ncbi:hypothetical protein LDO32_00365 [Luteimonas sp. Y-2-2-4F]|nr:hypothetical protein [Luteimonas sp. Y-2-2-4F]MCD9030189.1 hypothetical protein [Luteimonas sp. Y-2-2-4F]
MWGCALAFGLCGAAMAQPAATEVPLPPEEWRAYFDAALAADEIEEHEARCLAYPDLPGHQWAEGAARARCALLRPPKYDLDAMSGLLEQVDGAARLDREFATLLEAHYGEIAQREQIFLAYAVFDETPRAGEVAQRWLQRSPDSAYAHAALAAHRGSAGWKARGGAYAADTPPERFEQMGALFAQALPLYARALELEPRLSVACVKLMAIGRQSSQTLEDGATGHCLSVDPDSYHVVYEMLVRAQPRWGGSDDAMRQVVAYAQARVDRNPMLGALAGEAVGHRPSLEDHFGPFADTFAAAARMGPAGGLSRNAGRGYARRGDYWQAVAFLGQSSRFWPERHELFFDRGMYLAQEIGHQEWAVRDLRKAAALKPDDAATHHLLGNALVLTEGPLAARPHYRIARTGGRNARSSHEQYCQTFAVLQDDLDAFLDCTEALVVSYPENGEGWRMRAWALLSANHLDAHHAVRRFRALADPSNAFHETTLIQFAEIPL